MVGGINQPRIHEMKEKKQQKKCSPANSLQLPSTVTHKKRRICGSDHLIGLATCERIQWFRLIVYGFIHLCWTLNVERLNRV